MDNYGENLLSHKPIPYIVRNCFSTCLWSIAAQGAKMSLWYVPHTSGIRLEQNRLKLMSLFIEFVQSRRQASIPKRLVIHGAWEFGKLSEMQKYNCGIRVTVVTESKLAAFRSSNYHSRTVQENRKDKRVKISR